MPHSQRICGVILAAGKSSRMGREKALLPWPPESRLTAAAQGQTLLSAAIAALKPFTEAVIVVAGKNAAVLAPEAAAGGAILVENPDPDRGQFSSLQTGLHEALSRGFDAAMITPVDCPPLPAAALQQLCAAFAKGVEAGQWAVAPEKEGKHGHPLIAGRGLIDAFLKAPVTSNAREVRRAHERLIGFVPVAEPLLSVDLNTPEQYGALSGDDRASRH